ncbi:MAG TPA: SpoIIE family protein phosphatase [Thermoanaerobaculia bacterium]|nr:SpoIIE family protein phosphatase [Thermoanaerobaculia bacterium]
MSLERKILVVDDDPAIRRVIARLLKGHRVIPAANAAEGLAAARAERFDLALVDVHLGEAEGDGYALCRSLRAENPHTEVILITGSVSHADEKLYRSLLEDAFYFLWKPFDRRVLLALVERCLRLQTEREAKESYARRLDEDFERAKLFQLSLIPRDPVAHAGWKIAGLLESCDALGGDHFHTQTWGEDTVDFAISDVVGHGVSAAMYAGMLRSTLDAARRRSTDPERVVRWLFDGVDFFDGRKFATLVYGQLAPEGRLRYFNAAHPPPLLLGRDGISTLEPTGSLVCSPFRAKPPTIAEVTLELGDRLFAFTDGAFEARNETDEELGRERLAEVFEQTRDLDLGPALDRLLDEVKTFAGRRPLGDDVTLLLIERE